MDTNTAAAGSSSSLITAVESSIVASLGDNDASSSRSCSPASSTRSEFLTTTGSAAAASFLECDSADEILPILSVSSPFSYWTEFARAVEAPRELFPTRQDLAPLAVDWWVPACTSQTGPEVVSESWIFPSSWTVDPPSSDSPAVTVPAHAPASIPERLGFGAVQPFDIDAGPSLDERVSAWWRDRATAAQLMGTDIDKELEWVWAGTFDHEDDRAGEHTQDNPTGTELVEIGPAPIKPSPQERDEAVSRSIAVREDGVQIPSALHGEFVLIALFKAIVGCD